VVAFLRLGFGILLLPLLAIAQQPSSMEIETAPDVWTPCGNVTQPGTVSSPLITPLTPSPGSEVAFRLRKNSTANSTESVELPSLQFAPPASSTFVTRNLSEVQFSSAPPLPFSHSSGGTQIFEMALIPPDAGTYRFRFVSAFWDGGSCTVDVAIPEPPACLIESIEGITEQGPTLSVLDFGSLPVGQVAVGTIRFNFFDTLPAGEGIRASTFLDPPFQFDEGSYAVSPSRDQATLDVTFAPEQAGSFSQAVEFFTDREEQNPECRVSVDFLGEGVAPQVSLTFGTPACGAVVEIPLTVRNEGEVGLVNLRATAPAGYNLVPDPPGSFNVNGFALGAAGSSSPPAERRVLVRLVQAPTSAQSFVTIESDEVLLARGEIPSAPCIQIVEPEDLTLEFGNVPVNTPAPAQSIVIANRGNSAVNVTARLRNGGLASGFGLGPAGAANITVSIPPISQEPLAAMFRPTATGAKQSFVDFTSTSFADIPSVNMTGTGTEQPQPTLSFRAGGTAVNPAGTIQFPATAVGQSVSVPLVITNDGNLGALNLALNASGGEFTSSGSSPAELAPGQSVSFNLTFAPNQTGTRSGQLNVSGQNLNAILFTLQGDGVVSQVTVNSVGLSGSVQPAQTPFPTIGLELPAGAASQTLEGDLLVEFMPNFPQAPPAGFAEAYQAVRFVAGTGTGGRTIRFRFEQGQQRAIFPAEQQAGVDAGLARFQSGTAAGSLQFRLANVKTLAGVDVPVAQPIVGTATVARLAPVIRSTTTPQITGGINIVVQAVSTTREITGVCLALNPAPGADLSFTRPDPAFLNTPFSQWFTNSQSFAHGGAFSLTIAIDISNMQAFGSAQIWLRNAEGWSSPNSPCP
jgi:hypothetical protein